jgi:pilus assembly protein Flp/PilA
MLTYFNGLLVNLLSKAAVRDEDGQTYVEYALLIAFIAIIALVAVKVLGNSISSLFASVAGAL